MIIRPLNSVFISALFWLACSPATQANELLRIPFACEVTPRGVVAYPSRNQSYAIIGGRDAAPFTACAYNNPNRCRTMILHRFDIDCQGRRISWPEFYAAISERRTGRRARFAEGHLVLRVRPELRPERRRSRFGPPRFTAPRFGRPFDVEMPDGYAPVRGTLARFDGGQASPRRSIQATRDPFSAPQYDEVERRFARQELTPKPQPPASRSQPNRTADLKKPKARTKPSVQEKTAAKAKPADKVPTKQTAVKTAPKTAPSKAEKKVAVRAPNQNTKTSTEPTDGIDEKSISVATPVKKTEPEKTEQPIPSVVPTLLNGSKTEQRTITNLLQDRAAHLNKNVAQKSNLQVVAAQSASSDQSQTVNNAARSEPAPPSLTNTLAVLGVVASLLLGLSLVARRGRAPKPSPQQVPIKQPSNRRHHASKTTAPRIIDLSPTPEKPTCSSKADTPASVLTEDTQDERDSAPITLEVPVDRAPDALFSSTPSKPTPNTPSQHLLPGKDRPHDSCEDAQQKSRTEPQLPMPKVTAAKPNTSGSNQNALIVPKMRQLSRTAFSVEENIKEDAPAKGVSERAQ